MLNFLPVALLFTGCTKDEATTDPSFASSDPDSTGWEFGEIELVACAPGDNGIETGFTQTPIHGRTENGALLLLYTEKDADGEHQLQLQRRFAGRWSRLPVPEMNQPRYSLGKSSLVIADPYVFMSWAEELGDTTYVSAAFSQDLGESWSDPVIVETVEHRISAMRVNGSDDDLLTRRGTSVMGVSLYAYTAELPGGAVLPRMVLAWEERYFDTCTDLPEEEQEIEYRNIFTRAWHPTNASILDITASWTATAQLSAERSPSACDEPDPELAGETGENVALGGYGETVYAVWEVHENAHETGALSSTSRITSSSDGGVTFDTYDPDVTITGTDAHLAHTGDYLYLGIQGRERTYLRRCCETCPEDDGAAARCADGKFEPAWEGRLVDKDDAAAGGSEALVECPDDDTSLDGCLSRGLFAQVSADPVTNDVSLAYKRWQPDPCEISYLGNPRDPTPTTGDQAFGLWYGFNDLETMSPHGKMLKGTAYNYDYSQSSEACEGRGYFDDDNQDGEFNEGEYEYVGNWEHGIRSAVSRDHLDLVWLHAFDNIGTLPYSVGTHARDGRDLYHSQIKDYNLSKGLEGDDACDVDDHLLLFLGAERAE